MKNHHSLETRLIHSGEPRPRIEGAVVPPIFQSAMFEYGGETAYEDLKYIRLNNTPNHVSIQQKLASLENSEAALVTSSGMSAISTALLTILTAGDHLLAQDCLYGGTHHLVTHVLPSFGIDVDLISGDQPEQWQRRLRPSTRAIYVETMSNPLLQLPLLSEVVVFAREHGILSLIDNTFASPVNFRPPEIGFDLSLHSATKYLNGHSDIVAGACIGKADLIQKITARLNHLGGSLDPHALFLLNRGLKTLALRVRQQNTSAGRIAAFLKSHQSVSSVKYPGLTDHPGHSIAAELFEGFGGVLSFELIDEPGYTDRFLSHLTLPAVAPSLGGVETLITRPATTSHSGMSAGERRQSGITDNLIRLSVGIESTDDLLCDLDSALSKA